MCTTTHHKDDEEAGEQDRPDDRQEDFVAQVQEREKCQDERFQEKPLRQHPALKLWQVGGR